MPLPDKNITSQKKNKPEFNNEHDSISLMTEIRETIQKGVNYLKRIAHYVAPVEATLIAYTSTTVTVATPVRPGSPDILAAGGATGYDRIAIYFEELPRISDKVWVICDGPGSLFVITTYDFKKWSGEDEILPGEWRAFTTVYELRVRSPNANTAYRVTEYEPSNVCCTAASKTPLNILSNATILATASNTSASINVIGLKYMTVTLQATMNGAATANPAVTVDILTSQDNVTFDTYEATESYVYVTAISLKLSAGNARQKTSNLIDLRGINYIKIVTTNKDAAQSVTGVSVDINQVK